MLIGNYKHTIDPKKRLSIPSKWRAVLGEKVIVTNGLDQSLFLFSINEWNKIAEKLVSFGFFEEDSRKFTRYMLSNAFETNVDSHGRVLIPDQLVKHSKLKDEVILAGVFNRIEIWDKEVYENVMSLAEKDAEDMAKRIAKISSNN